MVTKSTIVGGIVGITTFLIFPGNPLSFIGSGIAGLTTAVATRYIASRYIFHEGETKAERKPESHRDRTIEEIRRKLEGFEEMPRDAQRELVLELCVTHSISPEIRESLLEKLKTAAYEAKAELIERVRDSLPERG